MLKTRIITAVLLLALLLAIVSAQSYTLFALASAVFFAAASWECFRLFKARWPLINTALWTILLLVILFEEEPARLYWLYLVCVAIWLAAFAPSLAKGLPTFEANSNRVLGVFYILAISTCFLSIAALFKQSALYLVSVMAVVWIADIGAYFSGKAFGKRKLAPSISPGKSWEGAIGGGLAVLAIAAISTRFDILSNTFATRILSAWGWFAFFVVLIIVVAASIVGDLFESQLKRRAGMKDSSNLLPGHGGVLDRIDALIPVLPVVMLLGKWL